MEKLIVLRNALRVLGFSSALVMAVGFGAGVAKADISFGGGNGTTGPNSENENLLDINNRINIDITNRAFADNDSIFCVDTGANEIQHNTVANGLYGGNVFGDIEVDNTLNGGDIDLVDMDPGNISFDLANDLTGPNSENENEVFIDVARYVDIDNIADIDNDFNLRANTGYNEIQNNTEVGCISTGDISFNIDQENIANASMGYVDLSGLGYMDIEGGFTNNLTGPCSENENTLRLNANSYIDIYNQANIDNDQNINANTGGNEVECNTVVGDISTGDVHINVSTFNRAN